MSLARYRRLTFRSLYPKICSSSPKKEWVKLGLNAAIVVRPVFDGAAKLMRIASLALLSP